MGTLAALPPYPIRPDQLPSWAKTISVIASCALHDETQYQPALLSDLGGFLRAQESLYMLCRKDNEFQENIATLFSLAAADPILILNPVEVARVAVAQANIGQYSSDFWAGLERSGVDALDAEQFSVVVHAAAMLQREFGAPPPSAALQQHMLRALQARDHAIVGGLRAIRVSDLWWAFAVFGLALPDGAHAALQSATVRHASAMSKQDVICIWWAFSKGQRAVPPETHDALVSATLQLLPTLRLSGVCFNLWALAVLKVQSKIWHRGGEQARLSHGAVSNMTARMSHTVSAHCHPLIPQV